MCGRYIANSEAEIMEIREILKQISMRFFTAEAALTEIFPTNQVMLINKCESMRAKWGIEKWDKKGVIINAKSETYEQSRFFKSFVGNRCIIPAHGYYEWQTLPYKKKIKYAFTSGEKHGIFMAGIYDKRGEFAQGCDNPTDFAIITKPANEDILHIHPRMPLIVRAEQAEDWLNGRLAAGDIGGVRVIWEEVG